MFDTLQNQLQLSGSTLLLAFLVVILAGMVRGFSGFGLSALVMAGIALFIPPIALIPVCYLLETAASLVMVRGGIRDANRRIVFGLVVGSAVGMPMGLSATHALPPALSSTIALTLILLLAMAQLFKISPAALGAKHGVYIAGLCAGIVTGLASLGGMIVALYALSLQNIATREIRGSVVLYLFIGIPINAFWLLSSGTLDMLALKRGLMFAPLVVLGVLMGTWLFRPSLERFYKTFCLSLLISLALFGLARLGLGLVQG